MIDWFYISEGSEQFRPTNNDTAVDVLGKDKDISTTWSIVFVKTICRRAVGNSFQLPSCMIERKLQTHLSL